MSYRTKLQYRSWNASALGLKNPEESDKSDKINDSLSKDYQKPRRESWSQPPQRGGRAVRGRGTWMIDNRPNVHRRHTMPNSNSRDDFQDRNYNYDESNNSNHWEEDNPIAEEPREKCEYQTFKENSSRVRKYSVDNIYRPPKSRSASYASSDDGSHTKYEPKNINNEPDQWTHDKYEFLESDQKDTTNASAPVSPLNINNEFLKNNDTQEEVSTCEFSKPESPKDEPKTIFNSEHPNVITINIRDLAEKGTSEELKAEAVDLEVASEVNVTPKIIPETNPIVTPEVTDEANPKVNSDVNYKMNLEIIHETNLEVTPVEEELPLINLDEDVNTGTQSIQTRISEDILTLDWDSYQKDLMEQELKLSLERQTIQTPNPRKLDTELMAFDSLL